jgi:hypothetical protein
MNTRPKPNQPLKTKGMPLWQILSLVMLVVLAVVCVPVVAVLYLGWTARVSLQDSTNISITEITLGELRNQVTMYRLRVGSVPQDLEMLVDGPTDNVGKSKWLSPIVDEIGKDSWDNEFVYTVKSDGFEIRSAGLDEKINTDDDLVVRGR